MPRHKLGPGPGRPKGAPNKTTKAHKEWAHELLTSEEWRESARTRIIEGKAPHLESLIVQQITGKPKDVVEVNTPRPVLIDLVHGRDDS